MKNDLSGQRFNNFVVNKFNGYVIHGSRKVISWECSCDCGDLFIATTQEVKHKRKACPKCSRKMMGEKMILSDFQAQKNLRYYHYKTSAEKRNIDFNLSIEEFIEIAEQNCHYCNNSPKDNEISTNSHKSVKTIGFWDNNGIDRIDSSLGYFKDNCVPCCKTCNQMKSDLDYTKFLNKIEQIANNVQRLDRKVVESSDSKRGDS